MKQKISTLISAIIIYSLNFVSSHSGDDFYSHHNMMNSLNSGGMFWSMSWIWIIISLLLIAILVLTIILLIKKIKESKK